MSDTLLIIALILGFFWFGAASLAWPHRMRRFNFHLMRLVLPLEAQVVVTRIIGDLSIAFAALLAFGLSKSLLR